MSIIFRALKAGRGQSAEPPARETETAIRRDLEGLGTAESGSEGQLPWLAAASANCLALDWTERSERATEEWYAARPAFSGAVLIETFVRRHDGAVALVLRAYAADLSGLLGLLDTSLATVAPTLGPATWAPILKLSREPWRLGRAIVLVPLPAERRGVVELLDALHGCLDRAEEDEGDCLAEDPSWAGACERWAALEPGESMLVMLPAARAAACAAQA